MTSKSLALLLADLGVRKSHNRPYTSNDNPFSEAQFKTMKYHPGYPDRFGSLAATARRSSPGTTRSTATRAWPI
ncbi:MAG: transposase family protein [bacterium]|nr:transposase family protein [bacterium]